MEADHSPRSIDLALEPAFEISGLQVRPATLEVIAADHRQQLEPRIMQVLVALARRRGDVVSRGELSQTCWAGRTVGDDSINRCLYRLRKLAEAWGGFRIETIPTVGYRLLELAEAGVAAIEASPQPRPSIAVLPFANLSDDRDQQYFSDGISEDIITDLGKVSALFVAGRATAFALRYEALDAREVARRLNVDHVLTGSVRKDGDRVRISAQLIDGRSGGQVWAERYDRELSRIFALQDQISQAIVHALKVQLLPAEVEALARRGTNSAEAYDLHLLARQEYMNGDQGDPRWAAGIIRLCERATEIDPNYAHAWAQLALGHVAAGYLHGGSTEAALSATDRALALDPNLADAHAVRARYFNDRGRAEEADREIEMALRLDPQSWLVNYAVAVIRHARGGVDEAIGYFERATALGEADFISPQYLIHCYRVVQDPAGVRRAAETALARVERALEHNRINGFALAAGADILGALGQTERAKAWTTRALLIDPDNIVVRMNVAGCLAMYFEGDDALDVLEPALAVMGPGLFRLTRRSHRFERFLDHPRYKAMMARAETRLGAEETL